MHAWTPKQVARLVGVPYRTARRWLSEGLVSLRLHRHPRNRERLWLVQDDIEELWAIACLRKQGVSMQRLRRILVRLAGMRLSEFKAVVVVNDEVLGIREGEPWERLRDGQFMIRLTTIRAALVTTPGERLGEVWTGIMRAQEVGFGLNVG